MKRIFVLIALICMAAGLRSQDSLKQPAKAPSCKLKLTLIDQTVVSLPTIKAGCEILLKRSQFPAYVSAEVGYNYYSEDESVKSSGYFLGARLHQYTYHAAYFKHGLSVGAFYLKANINDYLKVTKTAPGLGTYNAYEKKKFYKERFGLTVEYFLQAGLGKKFFVEACIGTGFMKMYIYRPSGVTQQTYVNGAYYRPNVFTLGIFASLKLGYSLFGK